MEGYPPDRRERHVDGAYILAILYTIGYLSIMGALLFVEIPNSNREIFLSLIGIMSAAQLGIIKYYYDGTKAAESTQKAGMASRAQADTVIQEIAKTVPAILPAVAPKEKE